MPYVQFKNTVTDIEQCYETLQVKGLGELSESERNYAERLINTCIDIAEQFGDQI